MRKIFNVALFAILTSFMAVVAGRPIAQSELPKNVQEFISKHFAGDSIVKAEVDSDDGRTEYEVKLESGAEAEFRADGSWKDVKSAWGKSVPDAVVPTAIAKYVADNYKGLTIKEISRNRRGYEVELSNDTEVKFTPEGQFVSAKRD